MTKFNNLLFFSVLFLTGGFSASILLGGNLININQTSAFAESNYMMTCLESGPCVFEELLPEEPIQAPEHGVLEEPKESRETLDNNASAPEEPEENPNGGDIKDNTGPIIEPEYRGIFEELSGEAPEYEDESCAEEPISEREKETAEINFEEPSAAVVEVNIYGVIADPEYLPKNEGKDTVEDNILEIVTKNKTKDKNEIIDSLIFIPKAPNTGRP